MRCYVALWGDIGQARGEHSGPGGAAGNRLYRTLDQQQPQNILLYFLAEKKRKNIEGKNPQMQTLYKKTAFPLCVKLKVEFVLSLKKHIIF